MDEEQEWEKEQKVRLVLEQLAKGSSISDTVLVPLMQANK